MKQEIIFKRKVEQELRDWKKDEDRRPLIVEGLRQVGKSYIVKRFAEENYENIIVFDFRFNKALRQVFEGSLEVDDIIRKASPYFIDKEFIPYKTILIFEEIGDCPQARSSLKSFALDKRFDVIATGSLLGVLNYKNKQKIDIPTGYEKIIEMKSLDFEEFLWANGVKEKNVEVLKTYAKDNKELPLALASFYKEMLKRYVVIGGLPDSIKKFLETNNYIKSREYLLGLIKEYRGDFGRFINSNNEEMIDHKLQVYLNMIFDSIPSQLAREQAITKFKYSDIKKGGRTTDFEEPFEWLENAGLVLRCNNVSAIEKPLEANCDKKFFKAYLSDIGLLMAMYPLSTTEEFLNENLDSRKGAIFENLAATMIDKCNLPLYYFCKSIDHLEIDFLLETKKGIVLIEEKSVNGKMAASKAVMTGKTKYTALKCLKVIRENFGQGDFFTSVPQYAFPFILEEYSFELKKGVELPPLKIPSL